MANIYLETIEDSFKFKMKMNLLKVGMTIEQAEYEIATNPEYIEMLENLRYLQKIDNKISDIEIITSNSLNLVIDKNQK